MPVFDLVTTDDNSETISDISQRVIGATQSQIEADVASVKAGGPTPVLLINGAQSGDTIPNSLLRMYQQFYRQSTSIPNTTGLSYRDSLIAGGALPYDGQGAS
jgi:hypothetical protein